MTDRVELMNLFWSTAGMYPGNGEISPHDFRLRVESASRAGFKGIGLWVTDLEHIMIHHTLPEMRSILDDNGMTQLELEFLTDWFIDGARRRESDSRRKRLLEASTILDASHVKVGDFYNTPCEMPRLIDEFAALCKDAEDHGARIGFEFMGSAMLNTIEDSLKMVEGAGATNGGIIVDIVHVVSQGFSYDEVSRIPAHYLVNVELNDGTLPSNPQHDTSGARRFCGEGDYDIRGFIAAIKKTGYAGPWAVEVFAPALAGLPLDELNRRAFETTLRYLNP